MLTVTAAALDRLSHKLTRRKASGGEAMRFTRTETGWRLHLDRADAADTTFAHQGRHVLLLDAGASKAMVNMTLDVRKTEAGPRLRLFKTPSGKN